MRLECLRAQLAEAVTAAHRVAAVPQAPDVIRLRATIDNLEVSGENYGYQIALNVPCTADETGEVFVPARILHGVVQALSGERIVLRREKLRLVLQGDVQSPAIRTFDGEYALQVPERANEVVGRLTLGALQRAVQRVRFACAREPVNPALEGALFRVEESRLRLIASDGKRAGVASVELTDVDARPFSAIIPQKTLDELTRQDADGLIIELRASPSRTQVAFVSPSVRLRTGVIGQQFPAIDQFLAPDSTTKAWIPRAPLLEILETGALLAADQFRSIRIVCDPSKSEVALTTQGPDGEQEATIAAAVQGQLTTVEVNCEYLRQGVASIPAEDILAEFGHRMPCVLRDSAESVDRYVLGLISTVDT